MAELYTKSWISEHLSTFKSWEIDAFQKFSTMVADDENKYPCLPSRIGLVSGHLRFGFVGDPRNPNTSNEIASHLAAYGECSRDTGKYASLVLFCETPLELKDSYGVQNYEDIFWSLLNQVSELDVIVWPSQISKDPTDPSWEFCFNGHPYFCFCGTPAHIHRKSRHFPYFLLAFQPRWVFEEMNDSTTIGRAMKKTIRERLLKYDTVPVHPSLKWYGQSENLEWKQYFLHDDNHIPSRCPFLNSKREHQNKKN
ncbi:YqcI/YcgG family protein [Bacillus sp. DJP31]|uniref:YqcI/YcgG family protein n=1 Tax=Bacillus sp. DJP31 TaxID=3409789 RepID=UPI003BB58692